jgi:hypothetical protein
MRHVERIIQPSYGPRFYRDEQGIDVFEHRISPSACIGPRPATRIDKENHADIWSEHLAQWTEEEDRKLKRKRG